MTQRKRLQKSLGFSEDSIVGSMTQDSQKNRKKDGPISWGLYIFDTQSNEIESRILFYP